MLLITNYLNFITRGVDKYLLISKWTYKSYLWLIYFTFNIPSFLFFSIIEKFIIKFKKKNGVK